MLMLNSLINIFKQIHYLYISNRRFYHSFALKTSQVPLFSLLAEMCSHNYVHKSKCKENVK